MGNPFCTLWEGMENALPGMLQAGHHIEWRKQKIVITKKHMKTKHITKQNNKSEHNTSQQNTIHQNTKLPNKQ